MHENTSTAEKGVYARKAQEKNLFITLSATAEYFFMLV